MTYFISRIIFEHFAFGLLIPVYIILLTEQIGLSLIEAGVAVSLATAATFIFEVPTGIIADRVNKKYLLLLSSLMHLTSYATLFFATDILLVSVSATLTGVAFALASGAEESYVHDMTENDVAHAYEKQLSKVSIYDEGATILGMIFSSLLLRYFDYSVLIGFAMFSLIIAVIVSFFLQNPRKIDTYEERTSANFCFKKNIVVLAIIFLLLALLSESGRLLWQPQLLSIGWSVAGFGYLYAAMKLGSVAGAYLAGSINIKNIYAILTGGIVGALGLYIFSINASLISLLGLGMFLIAENFVRIHTTSFIISLPGVSNQKATALSLFSLVNNSYLSLSSILLGMTASISLSTSLILVASIKSFAVLGLGVYIFTLKRNHLSQNSSLYFQTHSK